MGKTGRKVGEKCRSLKRNKKFMKFQPDVPLFWTTTRTLNPSHNFPAGLVSGPHLIHLGKLFIVLFTT